MSKKSKDIELSELNQGKVGDEALVGRDFSLVKGVNVELEAVLGSATISVDKLFNMKIGEVVAMNEAVNAPLNLVLDGKVVARGTLVAVDDCFGVKITEIA